MFKHIKNKKGGIIETSIMAIIIMMIMVGGIIYIISNSSYVTNKKISKAYESINLFNNMNFDDLMYGETFINNHPIKIMHNPKYPFDKLAEVTIDSRIEYNLFSSQKIDTIFYLNIENDNGKAKVVDVVYQGEQIVFK